MAAVFDVGECEPAEALRRAGVAVRADSCSECTAAFASSLGAAPLGLEDDLAAFVFCGTSVSVYELCRISNALLRIEPRKSHSGASTGCIVVETQAMGRRLHVQADKDTRVWKAQAALSSAPTSEYDSYRSEFLEQSFVEIDGFVDEKTAGVLLSALEEAPRHTVGPFDFRRYALLDCASALDYIRSAGLRAALQSATGLSLGGISALEVRALSNGDYQILHGHYACQAAASGLDVYVTLCAAGADAAFGDDGAAFRWHADCATVVYLLPQEGSDAGSDGPEAKRPRLDGEKEADDAPSLNGAHDSAAERYLDSSEPNDQHGHARDYSKQQEDAAEVVLAVRPRHARLTAAYRAPDGPALQMYIGHAVAPVPFVVYQLVATFSVL